MILSRKFKLIISMLLLLVKSHFLPFTFVDMVDRGKFLI